jgi:hypothetical protein
MNGYGAARVANAVRVSAAAAEAMLFLGRKGNKETCDVMEEEEGGVAGSGDSRCECDGERRGGTSREGDDINLSSKLCCEARPHVSPLRGIRWSRRQAVLGAIEGL